MEHFSRGCNGKKSPRFCPRSPWCKLPFGQHGSTMTSISMCTQAKRLLLLVLVVVECVAGARGASFTYITNESSKVIVATTHYKWGKSRFINRVIDPGAFQWDRYNGMVNTVRIEIWLAGARVHSLVNIGADRSIVAYDNRDGVAVDIYLAKYGTYIRKDGDVMKTLYPLP